MPAPRKPNLLLCLDAFGTIFSPRKPIATQYNEVFVKHGAPLVEESRLKAAFQEAWKVESEQHPNYGKRTGMHPKDWWGNTITNTFNKVHPDHSVPSQAISELLTRFSGAEGYAIHNDARILFHEILRQARSRGAVEATSSWPWSRTVCGVITNSDDRVSSILESLGLKVGPARFGRPSRLANEDFDVDFVVHSYDVGVEKPDRGIFEAAKGLLAQCLEAESSASSVDEFELLYVGDVVNSDVWGAMLAEWNAVLREKARENQVYLQATLPLATISCWVETAEGPVKGPSYELVPSLASLKFWRP